VCFDIAIIYRIQVYIISPDLKKILWCSLNVQVVYSWIDVLGIIMLFDKSWNMDTYWFWAGICNVILAVYSISTHLLICFLLSTACDPRNRAFLAIFGPIITSIIRLAASVWVLIDHQVDSGKLSYS
jgi:heme/copper-type cytochrome/quinol oxidase subunit 4